MVDAQLVTAIASEGEAHVKSADECVRNIKLRRLESERGWLQREIDRLQETGNSGEKLQELLVRKYDVSVRIKDLVLREEYGPVD